MLERKDSAECFKKNLSILNENIENLLKISMKPNDSIDIKPLISLKSHEYTLMNSDLFNIFSQISSELTSIFNENQQSLHEKIEKLSILQESSFHNKRLIALEQENNEIRKKYDDLMGKYNLLSAVI